MIILKGRRRKAGVLALDQRGSVLVLVMVVMCSLTILGMVLGSVAMNDQLQAFRQQKNNEAYYIARSGAETVAAVLLKNQEEMGNYIGGLTQADLGGGSFEARVVEGEEGMILIQSTGYAGDYSERVTLSLVGDGAAGVPVTYTLPDFDMAVFANSVIDLVNNRPVIEGHAGTNSIASRGVLLGKGSGYRINGNLYIGVGGDVPTVVPDNQGKINGVNGAGAASIFELQEERHYEIPEFPDFPLLPPGDPYQATGTISKDGYYEKIEINNNTITIDVGAGVRKIRTKELRLWGGVSSKIVVTGSGTLELYVEESFSMDGSSSINPNGSVGQVLVYYRGNSNVSISNSAEFYGCLFSASEEAGLSLTNSGGIRGAAFIKGSPVNISNGTLALVNILYAPNAKVSVTGSGGLKGAIVCDSFYAEGSGKVMYDGDVVDEIWQEVPEIRFDLGENPGSEPGSDSHYRIGDWSG